MIKRGLTLGAIAISLATSVVLVECGDSPATCDGGAVCVDASAVPPVSGGGCDSSKSAASGGCAVADSDGYFVSPTGADTADGSKLTPFKTIGKGISAAGATAAKPNVYVCAGTYLENLVISNAPAGVALHGGFDCASWAQGSASTIVSPNYVAKLTTPQYVLSVLGPAALVESMTLVAPDALDPATSSVAVFVDGSPGMTFRRATVIGGQGTDGVTQISLPALPTNTAGNNGSIPDGGAAQDCKCPGSVDSVGGAGATYNVSPAQSGLPVVGTDLDAGKAGVSSGNCNGNAGGNGANGKGESSTGTYGDLNETGWHPSPGGSAVAGGTGQGGGGADWNPGNPGIGGGGGGCGGCGGIGGPGGTGGGASIGIAVVNSTLRIQSATVRAGKAGSGGDGAGGQEGQPGGIGGVNTNSSCNGGAGGTGGHGGSGGGGAGGVSVAIATFVTIPVDIDTSSTLLGGTAGQGGHDGTAVANKAIDGISAPLQGF